MMVEVAVEFTVDHALPPPHAPIHDALEAIRSLTVEAATIEQGEHYADLLRRALIREGNRARD